MALSKIQSNSVLDGAITKAKLNTPGTVLQVIQVLYDTDTAINVSSWTAVSGFEATITPKDANSKILIQSNIHVGQGASTTTDFSFNVAVARNGILLSYNTNSSHGYGDIASYQGPGFDNLTIAPYSFTRLDSPNSTSALTYSIYVRSGGPSWSDNPIYLNRTYRFDDNWYSQSRARSTITLMEVAG